MWVQEFGITDEWTEPENFERYIRRSMMAAARCDSLWGFTWWCSHDIDKRLREFQPLEYGLGLLDGNNRPKPLADYIGKCIEDMKRGEKLPDLKKGAAIVIDESEPAAGSTAPRTPISSGRANTADSFCPPARTTRRICPPAALTA